MPQTPHTVSDPTCPETHQDRVCSIVPRTSRRPSSNSESANRSALALGVVSLTLAALNDASRFAPFPALREATGLAIAFLESTQVSTDTDVFESLTDNSSYISRGPETTKLRTPNLPRMRVDSF